MLSGEFFRRFAHGQEIGRDIGETHVSVFYDNGTEVGCWREERRSTVGDGSILGPRETEMARDWYGHRVEQEGLSSDAKSEQPDSKRRGSGARDRIPTGRQR